MFDRKDEEELKWYEEEMRREEEAGLNMLSLVALTLLVTTILLARKMMPISEPEPQKQETEVSRLQERKGGGQGELYECKPQVTIVSNYDIHKHHQMVLNIVSEPLICGVCRENQNHFFGGN